MKTILFNKLDISNFKGIEKLTVQFDNRTSLRGANGTGKTTVADALWWVLFNKDSDGSSDFPVKRKDKDGHDIHNILVDVSLSLSLNNVTHILRRTQEENWVTKRGSNEPVMEGNVQALYYNESKLKSKEYQEAVNQIMDEETFKLLTNPMFFMTQIDYKKRREILLRLVGNEKDLENSLRSKSSYFLLDHEWSHDINFSKTFTQFNEYVKQKSKQNQDELDRLPYQIDELERTIKDIPDELTLKSLIKAYTKELDQLNEVRHFEKPKAIVEAERLHYEKSIEHGSLVDKANQEYSSKRTELARMRQDIDFQIASVESKITLIKNEIDSDERSIDSLNQKRSNFLEQYHKLKEEDWVAPVIETKCPVCHQNLPDLNIDKLYTDDKLNFEEKKNKNLETIVAQGRVIANSIDEYKANQVVNINKVNTLKKEASDLSNRLAGLPQISTLTLADFVDKEKTEKLQKEINHLKETVNQYYSQQSEVHLDDNKIRKEELRALINDNNKRLGTLEVIKETQKRIVELKSRETTLVTEKNRFKTLVYLCEIFERDKNETIEQQLSSHFGQIKWKLFRQQVNGGYQQVCDPMLNGRPYEAQSTGERIYTGCDIIKTFQGVYEIDAPVLIDNRESLTLEIPLSSQAISMYADERYNVLIQQ